MNQSEQHFDAIADRWDRWKARNRYYHKNIEKLLRFLIPSGTSVLEIGCATGDLLNAVNPGVGMGIDQSAKMVEIAKRKFPALSFSQMGAEDIRLKKKFDFVIMSDLVGHLHDIQKAFENTRPLLHRRSRLIVTYYNFVWEPIIVLAEKLHLKIPQPRQNWVNGHDLENLLTLSDFEIVRTGYRMLLPKNVPLVSWFLNKYCSQLPLLRNLCVVRFIVARPRISDDVSKKCTVSVIVPVRNERGNIEEAMRRIPNMGKRTEIIFVEGHSVDGTLEEVKRVVNKYRRKRPVSYCLQTGVGKANAVRVGFDKASGDILMILDGDLTVAPEDLPKFFELLSSNKGEFVNGSRLVYPMEKQAMRFLNVIGNKFFSLMFTYLLDQRFKDTLCGTKALFREDYDRIAKNRNYFGEFDPFGDFDLIFGAAKQNMKIVELPIRYSERKYGQTNIQRWRHGVLLLKMVFVAASRLKFA